MATWAQDRRIGLQLHHFVLTERHVCVHKEMPQLMAVSIFEKVQPPPPLKVLRTLQGEATTETEKRPQVRRPPIASWRNKTKTAKHCGQAGSPQSPRARPRCGSRFHWFCPFRQSTRRSCHKPRGEGLGMEETLVRLIVPAACHS